MRRQFLLLIAIATFGTAFTANVSGQTAKTVKATVKFDFHIGDRLYPAGEYRIESIGRQPDNILRISSVRTVHKTQFIIASPLNTGKTQAPKLVFEKNGESYFLTKIVLESGQWGYSPLGPRRQRHSEKILTARAGRNN